MPTYIACGFDDVYLLMSIGFIVYFVHTLWECQVILTRFMLLHAQLIQVVQGMYDMTALNPTMNTYIHRGYAEEGQCYGRGRLHWSGGAGLFRHWPCKWRAKVQMSVLASLVKRRHQTLTTHTNYPDIFKWVDNITTAQHPIIIWIMPISDGRGGPYSPSWPARWISP